MMWPQLLVYASVPFFVVASIVKIIQYSRMPVHLRMELYPMADRAETGLGGYDPEDPGWWRAARWRRLFAEFRYTAREGLLFQKCYRNNKSLWFFTYPFHLGLFLLVLWLVLLIVGALALALRVPISESTGVLSRILFYSTIASGGSGLIMSASGCAGLIIKRATDDRLRPYTTPVDYFNLSLVLAVVLTELASWRLVDPVFNVARQFVKDIVTFSPELSINLEMSVGLALFSALLFYMPFSRMIHGLAKYFTYHKVFWENERKSKGSRLEKKLQHELAWPITWGAPHVENYKTWSEIMSDKKG